MRIKKKIKFTESRKSQETTPWQPDQKPEKSEFKGTLESLQLEMEKEEEKKAAGNHANGGDNGERTEEVIIDPEKFLFAWNSFLEDNLKRVKPNLYLSLSARMPEFTDQYTVTVSVENAALSDMLAKEKIHLASYFREKHGIAGFNLKITVKPLTEEENRKYLSNPREIYIEMLKINPDLENLQQELGLELIT